MGKLVSLLGQALIAIFMHASWENIDWIKNMKPCLTVDLMLASNLSHENAKEKVAFPAHANRGGSVYASQE